VRIVLCYTAYSTQLHNKYIMKVLLFFALIFTVVTPVTAVLGRRVLGQPVSEDVERRLKKMYNERRKASIGNRRLEPKPDFRRLSEAASILSRPKNERSNRKLPYYTGTMRSLCYVNVLVPNSCISPHEKLLYITSLS
jgi:hypothetical protein